MNSNNNYTRTDLIMHLTTPKPHMQPGSFEKCFKIPNTVYGVKLWHTQDGIYLSLLIKKKLIWIHWNMIPLISAYQVALSM